jgi:hypothetical protein
MTEGVLSSKSTSCWNSPHSYVGWRHRVTTPARRRPSICRAAPSYEGVSSRTVCRQRSSRAEQLGHQATRVVGLSAPPCNRNSAAPIPRLRAKPLRWNLRAICGSNLIDALPSRYRLLGEDKVNFLNIPTESGYSKTRLGLPECEHDAKKNHQYRTSWQRPLSVAGGKANGFPQLAADDFNLVPSAKLCR